VKIAIHRDPDSPAEYIEKWASTLDQASIEVRWVNLRFPDAIEQVRDCDGVMWHWEYLPHERQVAPSILQVIEAYLGIPVFPDHRTCWHYDDKIAQYYVCQALKVPMPPTWIFWDREPAREWARNTTYPKIFKLRTGSSSSNVHLVRTESDALQLIDLMFGPGTYPRGFKKVSAELDLLSEKPRGSAAAALGQVVMPDNKSLQERGRYWWQLEKNYVYFQDFLPDNPGDTRITVIGKRAFGFRRCNRVDDFRASGSKIINFDSDRVDPECVRLAHHISGALGAQSMAYDFLVDPDGRQVVTEMSYIYADWAIERCEGYWDPDLVWVPGSMWPQAAQVEDYIARLRDVSPRRVSR
jgi:glutathione synthase/RimK-type ligase-like ATP-grasp enzyme